ncbi:hypothetical protein ACFSJU_19485 [Paradesertivirga mongoliensis]|uniref:Uncharacterized protein n=1 Tax=Paradesertivirga mongoliensis TaxID=2100740 RepID=A0ABW4ZRE7_9SPHI|nr:hypothetical protein [Pedobacter mongoliensis]
MKKIYLLLSLFLTIGLSNTAFAASSFFKSDSLRVLKETKDLSSDLIKLKKRIAELETNIPLYEAKVHQASLRSKEQLEQSRKQSAKATKGKLKQIDKAEDEADEAKQAAHASKNATLTLKNANDRLKLLYKETAKKEARLKELEANSSGPGIKSAH